MEYRMGKTTPHASLHRTRIPKLLNALHVASWSQSWTTSFPNVPRSCVWSSFSSAAGQVRRTWPTVGEGQPIRNCYQECGTTSISSLHATPDRKHMTQSREEYLQHSSYLCCLTKYPSRRFLWRLQSVWGTNVHGWISGQDMMSRSWAIFLVMFHDFPVLLGHAGTKGEVPAQVLGLPNDHSPSSISSHSDQGSLSDFDTYRLHWAPALTLLVLFIHSLFLLLWLCGLTEKRYATRLAMMPALSFFGTAQLLQGPEGDEPPPYCGSDTLQRLRPIWCVLDKYSMSGWGAACFFVLAFGEVTKEHDIVAGLVSCVLALAAICLNDSKCRLFSGLRARSTDLSHKRNFRVWLCVCCLSLYFALVGRHALLSRTDAAEQEVEANFHFFLLIFAAAQYMSLVHGSDPALSGCNSSSNHMISTTYILALVAIGIPFMQSVCQSANFGLSWSWQVWLLVEYCGLFFVLVGSHKFSKTNAQTQLVAEAWVMAAAAWRMKRCETQNVKLSQLWWAQTWK